MRREGRTRACAHRVCRPHCVSAETRIACLQRTCEGGFFFRAIRGVAPGFGDDFAGSYGVFLGVGGRGWDLFNRVSTRVPSSWPTYRTSPALFATSELRRPGGHEGEGRGGGGGERPRWRRSWCSWTCRCTTTGPSPTWRRAACASASGRPRVRRVPLNEIPSPPPSMGVNACPQKEVGYCPIDCRCRSVVVFFLPPFPHTTIHI